MKCKRIILILMFLISIVSVTALTPETGGVSYWNFSSVTDLWGTNTLTNNGATSSTEYPIFNISGDSSPTSFELINSQSDYLSTNYLVPINNDFSLSMLFKTNDCSLNQIPMGGRESSTNNRWWTQIGSEVIDLKVGDGTSTYSTPTTPCIDNTWYHIVWTHLESTEQNKFYINNNLIDTFTKDSTSDNNLFYGSGTTPPIYYFDGFLDEAKVYDIVLSETQIDSLYDCGSIDINCEEINISDSIERTITETQLGDVEINQPNFVPIMSNIFEVENNDTPIYFSVVASIYSAAATTSQCRITVDGDDIGSTLNRTKAAGTTGSMYLTTDGATYDKGNHSLVFECRKIGANKFTISNTIGVGHIQLDVNGEFINKLHIDTINTTSTGDFELIKSYDFETTNKTGDGFEQILVIDWAAAYENSAGSGEELNTYIEVVGEKNCSYYPRYVDSLGTGSVSGDCIINNLTESTNYTINVYAKGTNAEFDFSIHNKNFFIHENEYNSRNLNGTQILSSNFTKIGEINITIEHVTGNLFVKAGIPFSGNGTGTIEVYNKLGDETSAVLSRSYDTNNRVIIGQWLYENLGTGNKTIEVYARCTTANCTINGGTFVTYMTDPKEIGVNSFNVYVLDNYDNSTIRNFSVIDTGTYNFVNVTYGIIPYSTETLINLTIISDYNGDYFSTTILNHNVSENLTVYLNQTIINWDCYEKITGNEINCSSPLSTDFFNYNIIGNPHNQSVNVTDYYENIIIFNVTAHDNITLNATNFYSTNLSLSSNSSLGSVNNCTYNITGITYPSYSESINGYPSNSVGLIDGVYNILADCEGYAYQNINITIENLTQSINFELYTVNSIKLNFYDVITGDLMNDTNITVQFIGTSSQTIITSNGTIYIDLLSPDDYTIIFDAEGYRQGSYIFSLIQKSYNPFNLYMQPINDTELLLMTVKDTYGNYISHAQITIQRYIDDSWITEQIRETDFQGRTEAYFVLTTEFYNFLVSVDDITYFGVINSEANKKQIYAEDVNNGIEIIINRINDTVIRSYQSLYGITTSLTFVNTSNTSGYFRFSWDDSNNEAHDGVLKVYNDGVLECTSESNSEAGIIYCYVTENNTAIYTAVSSLDGDEVKTFIKRYTLNNDLFISWGAFGFAFMFIILVLTFFLYLESPTFSLFLGSGLFSVGIVFGIVFSEANITVISLILALTSLVAGIGSKRGGNG